MTIPSAVSYGAWAVVGVSWAVIAREDFLHKKIRHTGLAALNAAAALGWAALVAATWLGAQGRAESFHLWGYYGAAALTAALGWGAALGLWRLGVWPAGDAKLFGTLSLLVPLCDAGGGLGRPTAPLDALINSFLPAALATAGQAAYYAWRSKLRHQASFLWSLGPKRAWDFSLGAVAAAKQAIADAKASLGEPEARGEVVLWLSGALLGGAMSGYAAGLGGSTVARSLVFFAFFWLWGKGARLLGPTTAGIAAAAAAVWAASARGTGPVALETARMGLFGVVLWGGTRIAGRSLGGAADALPWGLLGLAIGPLMGVATSFFGAVGQSAGGIAVLMSLGLLYGVGTALVRLWETDLRHDVGPDEAIQGVVLAEPFVAAMLADDSVDADEFGRQYPDGLTKGQAAIVARYCRKRKVRRVPVVPTVSFAFWIFLGWVLTTLLRGNVLKLLG